MRPKIDDCEEKETPGFGNCIDSCAGSGENGIAVFVATGGAEKNGKGGTCADGNDETCAGAYGFVKSLDRLSKGETAEGRGLITNGIFVRAGLSVLNNDPYFSLNSLSTSSTVRSACPDIFIHELTTKNRTHNTPR